MSGRAITRRSLLSGAVGALAGAVARPAGALGSTLAAVAGSLRASLEERWLGQLSPGVTTIALAHVADLAGAQWRAPVDARIEMRFRSERGGWSGWVSAGLHGHGPEAPVPTGGPVGDPVWTGGTTMLQLRTDRTVSGVRLHLVDVSGGVGAAMLAAFARPHASAASLPLAAPVLAAGAGQPPIIARRAWAQGISPPKVAPEYGAVRMAFVHHTDNPNGYAPGEVPAMIRAIYVFHRYVNGWNDIGYNFVLDLYGRIFEARAGGIDEPVVGAQTGGYNLVSTGVAVLGTFTSVAPTAAARGALERLLAWKLSLHGLPAEGSVIVRVNPAGASYSRFPANTLVPLPRIAGHRDADATECPGNVLYRELPGIRGAVRKLAGQPARATLALAVANPGSPAGESAPAPTGGEASPAVPTLIGRLESLDGAPIAGASILVQARTVSAKGEVVEERTLAEAVTDARGSWSLAATFSAARASWMWLRALYPGSTVAGATISEPLQIPVTVSLGQPAQPQPTAPAAAPPAT
jgi:hypothetical protein